MTDQGKPRRVRFDPNLFAPYGIEYDVDLRDTIPSPVPRAPTPFERAVNAPPDTSIAFERGLVRFLLGAVAVACVLLAVALLTQCAPPQPPRTEAERVTYCARIAQAREDVARREDRAVFEAQLDEQADAGGCPR